MQVLSHTWTAVLATILLRSYDHAGATWAWRIVRLVHALPYVALAWGFGWVNGWFWQAPLIAPIVSAWLTSGVVAFCMCCSWFNDWRRGY